jgi:hypothetical protein
MLIGLIPRTGLIPILTGGDQSYFLEFFNFHIDETEPLSAKTDFDFHAESND